MLKQSKDFWKKKAQDQLMMAENDAEKEKALSVHQLGWDRRAKESKWLLKGVNKMDDAAMGSLMTKSTAAKKHNRFGAVDINLVKEEDLERMKKAKQRKQTYSLVNMSNIITRMVTGKKPVNVPVEVEKKVHTRHRDAQQILKEQLAEKLKEREERRHRKQFLKDSAGRIRVLQKVGALLKIPRMPTHHTDASEIAGFVPPNNEAQVEHYLEVNLRNYTPVQLQPVIEQLQSNEEVLEEDRERRAFKVSGRHHNYLGAHILYPLKIFPSTTKHLFHPSSTPVYPETKLLPDEDEIRRMEQQEELQFLKENQPIYKVKKSRLNMSRRQFRLPSSQVHVSPHDYNNGQLVIANNRHDHQSMGGEMSTLDGGRPSVAAILHATADRLHSSNNKGEGRINNQFEWRQKHFVDSDSVHRHPHGPLDLNSMHSSSSAMGDRDSLAMSESAAEDTLDMHRGVDYRVTEDPASKFYQAPRSAPPRYRNSTYRNHDQTSSIGEGPAAHHSSTADWHSDNALRSNYFSVGSTAGDPLVPVNMERYRSMKKLDRHRVKGGFHLISRTSRDRKLKDRHEAVKAKLAAVSDDIKQGRHSGLDVEGVDDDR